MPGPALSLAALLLLAAPDAPTPAAQPESRVLDRVVAIVEQQPLLLSELEFEARVALIQQGGTNAATAPLGEEDLAAALEWAIDQRLALAEADRLRVFLVDEAKVQEAIRAFQARFRSPREAEAFLLAQEATPAELAAVLRRDLRVSQFINSKVRLSARVTSEDLRRYYAAHAADFGGQPFESVRETIRALLTRDRYRALARKQLEELRARADVRTVAAFGHGAASPSGDAAPGQP